MKTITIKIPDSFTEANIKRVQRYAYAQVENEIRDSITIPVEEVARIESEIEEVKLSRETDRSVVLAEEKL